MSKIDDTTSQNGGSLEDNRIIYINGIFSEEMTKEVFEKIIFLEIKNPNKDILLIIDSYGGECHSFLALYDVIRFCRCNIATFCIGKSMSCGQMLLMSGTKGKRFASANSRILVHELSASTWGKLTEMEIDINEHKEVQKILEKLFKKSTGLSKKEIKELMKRDSFVSAKEAKKLGIIDHIVKNGNDLYKNLNL